MNSKYELTGEIKEINGRTLHRIKALIDIRFDVKAGALGGWIEEEKNLGCDAGDNSWIYEGGEVWGRAAVYNNSTVYSSKVYSSTVYSSTVYNSTVYNSKVDNSKVDKTADVLSISPIGSRAATLTVIFSKKGLQVTTGCFTGTLRQFEKAVVGTHGDNQYAQDYLAAIAFIKKLAKTRKAKK